MIAEVRPHLIQGKIMIPGSKSHTIRAVLLSVMAEGRSVIHNPLKSLDCKSALGAAKLFGAKVKEEDDAWIVDGVGPHIRVPDNYLDCGNSGSVAYFATPMAALADGYTYVTGDEQIRHRPIDGTVSAIRQLGGEAFFCRPGSISCPVIVRGKMRGGRAYFDGGLSQIVSGIMMTAPLLEEDTQIVIDNPKEKPYLQLTLDWMIKYGIMVANDYEYSRFFLKGKQSYHAAETLVAGDWSGAAFPLVAGVIAGDELEIGGVDFEDSQGDKIVADHLIAMGADIRKDAAGHRLIVYGKKTLHGGGTIDMGDIPDSLPALSIAAAFAEGDTTFTGLGHVRLKETDRVAVMEQELKKMGARIESGPDFMIVHGGERLHGARVSSHGDHRVAMALMVCGLWADGCTYVENAECAAVSFPDFLERINGAGAGICMS